MCCTTARCVPDKCSSANHPALYCAISYIAVCVDISRTVLWDRSVSMPSMGPILSSHCLHIVPFIPTLSPCCPHIVSMVTPWSPFISMVHMLSPHCLHHPHVVPMNSSSTHPYTHPWVGVFP